MTQQRAELWVVKDGAEKRRNRIDNRGITPPTPPAYTPNFVGDPGEDKFVVGWALERGTASGFDLSEARAYVGWPGDSKTSVIHDYSSNANGVYGPSLDAAHSLGFIASQSFKMPNYTAAQIASGAADAAIDTHVAGVCLARSSKKIWLCYYHEPEDNIGSGSWANFRAASRRIVLRCRAAGVTNVAWMPIYMNPWTWDSGSGRDWRVWHPDWTGTTWNDTLTMDLMGMDTYAPLPWPTPPDWNPPHPWNTATRNLRAFSQMFDVARAKTELPGYPQWDYVIPEFGMSNAMATDPNWLTWCQQATAYAIENRVKAFIYWDNSDDLGRWSFASRGGSPNPDANGTKLQGWQHIYNHPARVKVAA